jgi:hypothetical protein
MSFQFRSQRTADLRRGQNRQAVTQRKGYDHEQDRRDLQNIFQMMNFGLSENHWDFSLNCLVCSGDSQIQSSSKE